MTTTGVQRILCRTVRFRIRVKRLDSAPLKIASVTELRAHEAAIVKHINGLENGGMLFSMHPLRLLSEIGVELGEPVRHAVILAHPEVEHCGGPAFDHLATSKKRQQTRVTLRGLFNLGEKTR
jgi:hypothetical protein